MIRPKKDSVTRAGVLLACSMATTGWAQGVFDPNESFQPLSPDRLNANAYTPAPPSEAPATRAVPGAQEVRAEPLQWGPFRLRPHADYRFTYATDISTAPGAREDVATHAISPGITFEGRYVSVDYTPTLTYYTKGDMEDHIDHRASIAAGFGYGDWVFSLAHTYNKSGGVTTETATQVDRDTHATAIAASRLLTEKLSLDLTASQTLLFADEFNSTRQWSTMEWLNYLYSEKTTFGLGAGFGYADVDLGSDMTYEHIMGRVTWTPGPKLSLSGAGGVEIRQFLDSELSDLVNPIASASAGYQLFEHTRLGLVASRTVNTSLLSSQVSENTLISGTVSQRLLEHINLSVSGGFRSVEYQPSATGVTAERTDEGWFAGVSAGVRFLERGRFSVAYHRTENSSSDSEFTFGSNQYTVHLGYHF